MGQMSTAGLDPDVFTANALLRAMSQPGLGGSLRQAYALLHDHRVPPDSRTFSATFHSASQMPGELPAEWLLQV